MAARPVGPAGLAGQARAKTQPDWRLSGRVIPSEICGRGYKDSLTRPVLQ